MENKKYNIAQPLALAIFLALGLVLGYKMNDKPDEKLISLHSVNNENNFVIGRVEELLRYIEYKYVDDIDKNILLDEAIESIIGKLDPHSVYLRPSEVLDAEVQMNGSYAGLGIENVYVDDMLIISKIIKNSPADKIGLKVLDIIEKINDTIIVGKNYDYDKIREMLRHQVGNEVKLTVLRKGQKINLVATIEDVKIPSVEAFEWKEINSLYVKIDRFGMNTYREFMKTLEDFFTDNKPHNLIIDLRGNPGGYMEEAVKILSQIIEEKDKLLVYTEGKNQTKNEYKSTGKRFFPVEYVYIIIDERSASASEIVAGAIQDWDRGLIIGRRSFGKGLVQEQYPLNNGGALRLTTSRYFTPSGRSIQRDYSDKIAYDEEPNYRYSNGWDAESDSIAKNEGTKFTTLKLKRTVFTGNGIMPDVLVPLAEEAYHVDADLIQSLKESTIKYFATSKETMPYSIQTINNWKPSYELVEKVIDNYQEKTKDELLHVKLYQETLLKEWRRTIAKIVLGPREIHDYEKTMDTFIVKAYQQAKVEASPMGKTALNESN